MKIYRRTFALPVGEIGIEHGGTQLDLILSERDVELLERRFNIVRSLGEGMWGMAFLTSDDKVLKLTLDQAEYQACKDLQEYSKYGPFAKIYDIGVETGESGHSYYYILKELVQPLDSTMRMVFDDYVYGEEEDRERLLVDYPVECEKVDDYYNDVVNYPYEDTLRSDNVGIDSNGNIVAYDLRTSSF